MKQFLQKYYDSILLLIGIVLLLYLSMSLVRSHYLHENAVKNRFPFHKEYWMEGLWTDEELNNLCVLFENSGANCCIRDMFLTVGNVLDTKEVILYFATAPLSKNEEELLGWDNTPNSVLVDGRLKKEIYRKGEIPYILIDGNEYQVYEIINENEILGLNVHVNWKNMDDEHKKPFLEMFENLYNEMVNGSQSCLILRIEGKTEPKQAMKDFLNTNADRLRELWDYTDPVKYARSFLASKMEIFYALMVLLGVYCLFFLSEIWISRRKREFLIRRMLGCGYFSILWGAIRESNLVVCIAFILATTIELMQIGFHIAGNVLWHQAILVVICAFVFTVVMQMILFGYYVAKLIRIHPTQGNIESA